KAAEMLVVTGEYWVRLSRNARLLRSAALEGGCIVRTRGVCPGYRACTHARVARPATTVFDLSARDRVVARDGSRGRQGCVHEPLAAAGLPQMLANAQPWRSILQLLFGGA